MGGFYTLLENFEEFIELCCTGMGILRLNSTYTLVCNFKISSSCKVGSVADLMQY